MHKLNVKEKQCLFSGLVLWCEGKQHFAAKLNIMRVSLNSFLVGYFSTQRFRSFSLPQKKQITGNFPYYLLIYLNKQNTAAVRSLFANIHFNLTVFNLFSSNHSVWLIYAISGRVSVPLRPTFFLRWAVIKFLYVFIYTMLKGWLLGFLFLLLHPHIYSLQRFLVSLEHCNMVYDRWDIKNWFCTEEFFLFSGLNLKI